VTVLRRLCILTFSFILLASASAALAQDNSDESFTAFLAELWRDANRKGITRATFDAAFVGLSPDSRVIALTKRQPEYGRPFGDYVASMVSNLRITNGKRQAAQWQKTLAAVEKTFGVDPLILIAIWGIETGYGEVKARWDVFRSLATLAHARYRHPYFRNELLIALRIVQEGHVPRDKMVSSWAGAMGQPQFMPTSFIASAVDLSGDGRRDIWTSVPDVLGSMGNYMRKEGWQPGMPWGFEVVVPTGFDYRRSRGTFAEWTALRLRRADGEALPRGGDAVLFFPSGASGPAFLVTENFVAIKRYNNSDAYALAVAHLADRMRGRAPIRAAWPKDDVQLSRENRIVLQKKLAALGYPVRDFEGRIDFDLRDAIRDVQAKFGMMPDGHPTETLLRRLGAEPS
jgi:lytic murein transglycosylase